MMKNILCDLVPSVAASSTQFTFCTQLFCLGLFWQRQWKVAKQHSAAITINIEPYFLVQLLQGEVQIVHTSFFLFFFFQGSVADVH